jgi:hypothetical protein
MEKMEAPELDGERMMGTRAYLEMCWKYTQIFYSKTLPMATRVEYAAYVIHFLRLWRMYIYNTPGLTLKLETQLHHTRDLPRHHPQLPEFHQRGAEDEGLPPRDAPLH